MLPPSMLATPTSVKKSSEGASNGNGSSHYDATTVEQIKAQFQAQAVAAQEAATAAAVASAADATAATTAGYWGKVEPGFTANHDR